LTTLNIRIWGGAHLVEVVPMDVDPVGAGDVERAVACGCWRQEGAREGWPSHDIVIINIVLCMAY